MNNSLITKFWTKKLVELIKTLSSNNQKELEELTILALLIEGINDDDVLKEIKDSISSDLSLNESDFLKNKDDYSRKLEKIIMSGYYSGITDRAPYFSSMFVQSAHLYYIRQTLELLNKYKNLEFESGADRGIIVSLLRAYAHLSGLSSFTSMSIVMLSQEKVHESGFKNDDKNYGPIFIDTFLEEVNKRTEWYEVDEGGN